MRREAVGGHGVGDAGAAVVELLEYQAGVERVQPGATELLGDREVHQAQLPGLAHDVFGERLAFVVLRGDGNDLLGGEAAGRVLQLLLLGCELELHRARSASSTARPLPPAATRVASRNRARVTMGWAPAAARDGSARAGARPGRGLGARAAGGHLPHRPRDLSRL